MHRPGLSNERMVALFAAGALALTPPFLSIFNVPTMIGGVPTLYLYLFTVWIALIALVALVVSTAEREEPPTGRPSRHPEQGLE